MRYVKYFIFWIVALKGILKATFHFWYFLVGRKKYNKLLYPTMFLNLFISSSRFLCGFFRVFFIYDITSCTYHYNLTCSHPIQMILLIFLVWLLWLVLLILCWREVMRMGFFFLFQILAELAFNFSPLNIILAIGFDNNSFLYFEICSMNMHCGKIFYHEWMLNFESFFCFFWENHVVFVFCLCGVALIYLHMVNSPGELQMNP